MTVFLLREAVDRIGWLLVHSVWQFALIAFWLAMALQVMRRASASLRYRTCVFAWLLMLAAPAATWTLLPMPDAKATAAPSAAQVEESHRGATSSTPVYSPKTSTKSFDADNRPTSSAAFAPPATATAKSVPWRAWLEAIISPWLRELVALWCLGASLFALRPGLGWYAVRRFQRIGASAVGPAVTTALERAKHRLGVCQEVRVLQSAMVKVPLVIGCVRPAILLPLAVIVGLSAMELEAILAHELAHIRRRDYLVNLLQTLTETIFFYHPAMWWVSSRIRQEREHCCDELAAQALGSRVDYCRALVALEEFRGAAPALSLGAKGGSLLKRIQRLASVEPGTPSLGASGMAIMTLSVILLAGAGVWTAMQARDAVAMVADDASQPAAADNPRAKQREAAAGDKGENPAPGVVRGAIVNAAEGKPVVGARIILRGTKNEYATSDAEGRFQFEHVPPNPGQYEIWAYAGNLLVPKTEVAQTISADGKSARFKPLRLEMRQGKQVRFLVRSAVTGKPLEGAEVKFSYPDRRKAATSADGTALVQALHGQQYEVTVEAQGHARRVIETNLSQVNQQFELCVELDAGGTVRGTVVDEDGQSVADATVYYYVRRGYGEFGDAQRTDANGKFQNSFLPLGKPVNVSVGHDDFISQEQEFVLTEENRERAVSFTLTRRPHGKSIRGVVQDSRGKPVPAAHVTSGNSPDTRRETIANPQGEFTLDDLIEGYAGYQIYVAAKGFAPQRLAVETETADSPSVVNVTLMPGHSVHGRVVDDNGKPIEGASVTPRSTAYPFGLLRETVKTSAENGAFAFEDLPEDARFDVSAPGHPHTMSIALPFDLDKPATITLAPPGKLRGRVINAETGHPVRQFRVQLGFSSSTKPGDPEGTYSSSWSDPGMTFNSNDGKFVIEPLTNGMPLALTVLADDYERAVVERAVAAQANESKELTVLLEPIDLSQRSTLRGQLLNHDGRPAPGAQLRLIVSTKRPAGADDYDFNWALISSSNLGQKTYCVQFMSGVSGSDGRFEFKNILPGKFLQLAYWGDGVPKGRSLSFDKTRPGELDSVSIKLPQAARVLGKIERDQFRDAGSIRLSLVGQSFQEYECKLAEKQTAFEFEDLPPGAYVVSIGAKPVEFTGESGQQYFRISSLASQNIQLQPGETKVLAFTKPEVEKNP